MPLENVPPSESRLAVPHGLDLTEPQLAEVRQILHKTLINSGQTGSDRLNHIVWAFGSRATGRARPYSDLDLLVARSHPLDWRARSNLAEAFEASHLPFRVDVVEEAGLPEQIAQRVRLERIALPL
jgi:uncharacterized protein